MSAGNPKFCVFRWGSFCKPGMYLANVSLALGWETSAHIHAHCVVDDFGTLQPVEFNGLTVQDRRVVTQ